MNSLQMRNDHQQGGFCPGQPLPPPLPLGISLCFDCISHRTVVWNDKSLDSNPMLLDMGCLGYVKIYLRLKTGDNLERVPAGRVGFVATFIPSCLQSSSPCYSNSSPIWLTEESKCWSVGLLPVLPLWPLTRMSSQEAELLIKFNSGDTQSRY